MNDRPEELIPSDSSADELYEQGMAHYRRREWQQARASFLRLRELDPGRRGIPALLDEVEMFIRLQSLEPERATPAEPELDEPPVSSAAREGVSAPASRKDAMKWPWLLLAALVVVAALVAALTVPKMNQQNEASSLWNLARANFNVGNYEQAVETLERLVALGPTEYDVEANALLDRARELRDVKHHYDAAQQLKAEEQWADAVQELVAFDEICRRMVNISDPNLRQSCQEAKDEIPSLRVKAELATLYQEAKAAYTGQNWARAAELFQQLQGQDREYKRDEVRNYLFASYLNYGGSLVELAGNAVDQVELAIQLFDRAAGLRPDDQRPVQEVAAARAYLAALQAFHASEWTNVLSALEGLVAAQPAYAGGRAVNLLCIARLKLGNAAYDEGKLETALGYYNQVLGAEGCDQSEAELNQIKVLATLYPPTPTGTPTDTPTPTPTDTATPTITPTPTVTNTAAPTGTPTRTFTPRPPTATPLPPTNTPTNTSAPPPPPPTNTPPPPPTNTLAPTNTPAPTNTLPSRDT